MKVASINYVLSVTALALLAAIWQVRRPHPAVRQDPGAGQTSGAALRSTPSAVERSPAVAVDTPKVSHVSRDQMLEQTQSAGTNSPAGQPQAASDWAKVETSDYK